PHGYRRSSQTSSIAPASAAEQRFLSLRGDAARRGTGDRKEGARLHGDEGPADHQQVLGRGLVSVRAAAVIQGIEPRRSRHAWLCVPGRKPVARRARRHEYRANRYFVLYLLWRP